MDYSYKMKTATGRTTGDVASGKYACAVVMLLSALCLVPVVQARSLTDNHFFASGVVSWHSRDGMIDFGDGRVQHFERRLLRTQGITVGKNFVLPFGLRVAVPLFLEFGAVQEGTVEGLLLSDGSMPPSMIYKSVMYHVGCQPLVEFPFRLSDGAWGFGAIGGGCHYVALFEEEKDPDRNLKLTSEGDPYLEDSRRLSASAAAGAGMEFLVGKRLVFSIRYLFRFWKPVQRETVRDLFPLTMPYSEWFFTHGISAWFLFAGGL